MAKFENEGAYVPSVLMLGHHRARKVTIKAGAGVLGRGTVLGQITADKKYLKSIAAANDGSQVPDAILSADVDATAADVEAIVYIAGEVDQDKLILGAGHTLGSVDAVFRTKSIWLVKPMG
ncbi:MULTISPECIES: head decoration protein [Bradyrhizobium]|uniref:head decoration protein n=1 Tax=Bradyrhizobium TaxID=374 RepID=UPI000F51F5B1|nr:MULTISPECIES: head decoration protein [unclassified Bradyrhizobium]MDX3966157.1 head decoration protein [Bradyrhizobium sp.]RQH15975.1 head decoration protein [Bradyrhizobium sp. RP6]